MGEARRGQPLRRRLGTLTNGGVIQHGKLPAGWRRLTPPSPGRQRDNRSSRHKAPALDRGTRTGEPRMSPLDRRWTTTYPYQVPGISRDV